MKNKNKQTKFPVARIKKIMQKDEEVGKVAQATPIVISKALELFLGLIVDEASKVTAGRGSKKVEAYHLKHAVETTEMLDFLKEIVEAVPDPSAGGTIDLESVDAESAKKKRGKGKRVGTSGETGTKRRRKKKGVDGEVPGNTEGEVKSEQEPEPEADAAMDEDEDDEDRGPDHGGYSGGARYTAKSEAEDAQWKEDAPYLPRR